MREAWSVAMLISAGLFAAGVVSIAWERAPAWRAADAATFRVEFAHTLERMDRLQPALLLVCLISSVGFAVGASGTARMLAGLAASCFVAVLVGSGASLVPIGSESRREPAGGSGSSCSSFARAWRELLGMPASVVKAGALRRTARETPARLVPPCLVPCEPSGAGS
jgi:hypothetical protein